MRLDKAALFGYRYQVMKVFMIQPNYLLHP
jgi:hypothetical protein